MAAYAAVTSLHYTIHLIHHHPSPPISLDQHHLESLTGNITFFQRFLEAYVSPVADIDEPDPLEHRIAEAAYAAEDVIESYLVDNIHLVEGTSFVQFYQDLEIATEGMDLIKAEVMAIDAAVPLCRRNATIVSGNAGAGSGEMVGFDDLLLHLLDRLVGGGRSDRQIIPIVGMGGIRKTTLARNVFEHAFVKVHFDICVWATISQNYNIQNYSYDSAFVVDDMLETISSLPHLHKLRLAFGSFKTGKWEITQGQFQRLKTLELYWCDLQEWTVLDSSCFPLLRDIYLRGLKRLNEIPTEIGEIPTLKSIRVTFCSESAVLSAKKIVEEQEDLQEEQLDFHVVAEVEDGALLSLASPNFEVKYI